MKRVRMVIVLISLVAVAFMLASCGPDATVEPSTQESTTSVTTTHTTSPIPVGEPVEIQRFDQDVVLWKTWIEDDTVVWMQSAGAAAKTGLAYSPSPGWDTVFATASATTGEGEEIAEVRLAAPGVPDGPPYGLTLPLAWAAVLPGSDDVPFKLVWADPPEVLSETYLFHGLFSWSPGGTSLEVLPESSVSLRAQASGDVVAIPQPNASYPSASDSPNDPANYGKLLLMTANMETPLEVDPAAPMLPAAALEGLSPYFALLASTDSGAQEVRVFDLRTGDRRELDPAPSYPGPLVAGHHAAWGTENGDVYLADLDSGSTERVLSLESGQSSWPTLALGEEWLVVLKPWSSLDYESALADPSQHPGADLIALHLPDLARVDIAGVVPKGQVGSVQISGDTVLLTVSPAIKPMPHNEPDWVELQTLRLGLSTQQASSTTGSASKTSTSTAPTAANTSTTQLFPAVDNTLGQLRLDVNPREGVRVAVGGLREIPSDALDPRKRLIEGEVIIENQSDTPFVYGPHDFRLYVGPFQTQIQGLTASTDFPVHDAVLAPSAVKGHAFMAESAVQPGNTLHGYLLTWIADRGTESSGLQYDPSDPDAADRGFGVEIQP